MASRALKTVEDILDERGSIDVAMAATFAEIEAVSKDKINPHFKSKYADLGSVIESLRPILASHYLYFIQRCEPSEDGVIVETIARHISGGQVDFGKLFVPANKRDAQGFGSALTYARRYALVTAFGVPTEDDDGNAASRPANANPEPTRQERIAEHKDDPFPQGPAKNKTHLKDMGRAFWRDIEACGDPDELDCLLADKTNVQLVNQIMKALPSWWDGGVNGGGETFEGMEAVIARKRRDFEQLESA